MPQPANVPKWQWAAAVAEGRTFTPKGGWLFDPTKEKLFKNANIAHDDGLDFEEGKGTGNRVRDFRSCTGREEPRGRLRLGDRFELLSSSSSFSRVILLLSLARSRFFRSG